MFQESSYHHLLTANLDCGDLLPQLGGGQSFPHISYYF